MITCEHVQHYFEAYLNDEITPSLVAEVDAHCLECEGCRKQLRLLEACGNVIRLDTSEPTLSGDFTDRLVAIMADRPRQGLQLHRRMKLVCGLLGVAAVVAFGLMPLFRTAPTTVIDGTPIAPTVAGENTIPGAEDGVGEALLGQYLGLPVHRLFGVSESLPGAAELGQITINKLNDAAAAESGPQPVTFPDPTLPSTPSDAQDAPPAFDDGGELM